MTTPLRQICLSAMIAIGFALPGDAGEFAPAVAEFEAEHPDMARSLSGHIWYPSEADGAEALLRGSAVWRDITGHLDARIAPGVFPVVLISHGMYGNSMNQAWLAKRLAAKGIIAIQPNHPGTTSFGRDPDQARQLWLRATDLSVALDAALADPRFADHIDPTRVAAAGHSLGGHTVMAAAGARHDVAGFATRCADTPERPDCAALAMWNVGADPADHDALQSDRSDPRIRTVIALDLGGAQTFAPDSLAAIDIPVLVLGAGRGDMLDQEIESRALAAALPDRMVSHIEVEDAGHFDYMGLCTETGYEVLKREEPGDEIVCVKGQAERQAQHERIFELIVTHLTATRVLPTP
ncbi:alpha/beta hydrolase family protein [Roseobacter sinensis]|uniref:Prolyl oligopeptidase family serine peptidase n=1 Tax=Roseobacter sinensis TaxID=2931391 RepID=A0ABT3BFJ6_9RHOB|nr:alpha/beta fold hydrolase [Roseobacter sp. WL0113]MCV3272355.1 prolyl oligopeptidase family serine peptidase [Roseobacter sp. WL0113]